MADTAFESVAGGRPAMNPAVPRVYVVVLNWNGSADTRACIDALGKLDYPNACFVVCDNLSRDDDLASTRSWGAQLPARLQEFNAHPLPDWPVGDPSTPGTTTLIHTGANLGFAGGVNVGLRYALTRGDLDYAWVLNNDTAVDPAALSALVRRMAQDPSIGICGSSLVYFGERERVQAHGGAAYQSWRGRSMALGAFSATRDIPADPSGVEARMDYVIGASMLVSRRFLETVGLMDDRYFLYSEEHDWAHRGRHLGFKLAWAPDSIVFHKHGATIGTSAQGGSTLSLFYLFRSKALFALRHTPLRLPVVLVSLLWECAKFMLKGHPRKAWAAFRGLLAFPGLRSY